MAQRQRLVILGGGTAGWLAAAWLARALSGADKPHGWDITLIESAQIGTIGVGEGSFPTLRATIAELGRSEAEFIQTAQATFKQGVRFVGWAGGPTPGAAMRGPHEADDYFHPFDLPQGGEKAVPFWLDTAQDPRRPSLADAQTIQERVIRAGRAPKRAQDPDFNGPLNYAYHFDAVRLAAFLRDVAQEAGITRIEATVSAVDRHANGDIARLHLAEGQGAVEGDFFLDCSGFHARLIGAELGAPFQGVGDVLFNDRAIALQIPDAAPDQPIAPYTISTAHAAGWIWDIGLPTRRGTGCVYSSAHMSDDEAEGVLRAYGGPATRDLAARHIRYQTGYRTRQWVGNCAAVGLSAGFFEPLESTGVMLIEVAVRLLGELLDGPPDAAARAAAARQFDRLMVARFAAIVDFLKLHYCVSRRDDTPYWRANTDPASWTDTLRDRIAQWRIRPPSRFDFVVDHETFLPPSWAYILFGMGFGTRAGEGAIAADPAGARAVLSGFGQLRQAGAQACAALPAHRDLITHYLRSNGMRP